MEEEEEGEFAQMNPKKCQYFVEILLNDILDDVALLLQKKRVRQQKKILLFIQN